MELSPIIHVNMSFETIHSLNCNTQCQKHLDVTNDVKFNFLICRFVGCMKNMLFLGNIFFIILCMCDMEFAEKLTPIHFGLMFT